MDNVHSPALSPLFFFFFFNLRLFLDPFLWKIVSVVIGARTNS